MLQTINDISSLTKEDGSTATTSVDKAETFNKFYASVFTLGGLAKHLNTPLKTSYEISTFSAGTIRSHKRAIINFVQEIYDGRSARKLEKGDRDSYI